VGERVTAAATAKAGLCMPNQLLLWVVGGESGLLCRGFYGQYKCGTHTNFNNTQSLAPALFPLLLGK
jgi:hypothetical protein